MWITNAPIADIAIVWAKTEEIVEKDMPGFQVREIKHKMSLRAFDGLRCFCLRSTYNLE
jgi:glutaryl-CoA dehydrogenase